MNDDFLKRYTDIPALACLLSEQKLTLLDPESWDDRNDSHYLAVYKEKRKLKTVLAICFTQASETYHHWRVFAGNTSGVCIRFNRAELLKAVMKRAGVRCGEVEYFTLEEIRKKKPAIDDLPFIKRYAFRDEKEYRVVYESRNTPRAMLDIPIPLSCVDGVALSPWAHRSLAAPLRRMLRSISGCGGIDFYSSTVVSNEKWKNVADSVRAD